MFKKLWEEIKIFYYSNFHYQGYPGFEETGISAEDWEALDPETKTRIWALVLSDLDD